MEGLVLEASSAEAASALRPRAVATSWGTPPATLVGDLAAQTGSPGPALSGATGGSAEVILEVSGAWGGPETGKVTWPACL